MMVLITSNNSNDESQSTQLRITKKLATVCSGKRSRFSKPRPNLAISKRGESSVPAGGCKSSNNSEKEAVQNGLNSNIHSNKNTKEEEIISLDNTNKKTEKEEIISLDNANKKTEKEEIISLNNANKKTEKEEIISLDNTNKKIVEDDIEIVSYENANKKIVEADTEIHENAGKIAPVQSSQIISSTILKKLDSEDDSVAKKLPPVEDTQAILNADDVEKLFPEEEDIAVISNTNVDKNSKDDYIQASPVKKSGKNSKENVQVSPVTNSGSPLKASEPEKRGASNAAPTAIDKSKYPHLTSILTKKRSEPRKEVQQKRRKKFKKGDAPPERSKMTMADLIYWNPAKTDEPQKSAVAVNEAPIENVVVEEECIDDDDDAENENNMQDSVPKLVISEDGTINIDQSSLFVSRNVPQPVSTEIVRRDDTTYSSFRKRPLTKHWTAKDTANFYRALSLVGADFSLMEQIFPNRTRRELKQKFKREEKFNIDLINKVLYESQTFDELTLNDFMDQNAVTDDPTIINDKDDDDDQTVVKEKSRKQRTSKKTKSTANESSDSSIDHLEEETENEKLENNKGKKKKGKKSSDDEDVEILIGYTSYNDTGEQKISKRKRNAKRLPDDFVSTDSIEGLEVLDDETNNDDALEIANSSENQENCNDAEVENNVEEIPSEPSEEIPSVSVLMSKIYETTDIQQKEISNTTMSLSVANGDEDYNSIEYIKNGDVDADLTMLSNVMAYEVVNTQTPVPKKRRKILSVSPGKSGKLFLATKISPTNYTNYTPV